MDLSIGALRKWWDKSSKQQRMLAVLALIGILATGTLLLLSDSPANQNLIETGAPVQGNLASLGAGDSIGSSLYYVGVVIKVVAVLLLIIGGAVILRRWQTKRGGGLGRRLGVVESVRLSPKQALHLVRVGDRQLLIGATDQAISLICDVQNSPVDQALTETVLPARPASFLKEDPRISFGDLFRTVRAKEDLNESGGQP
jgi:flagellar biosynthetic protein FliO